MKISKRIVTLALTIIMTFAFSLSASMTVNAATVVSSGECGDNLTWKLVSDGTLTIRGEGKMWGFYYDPAPWSNYLTQIKLLRIESGVTGIGEYAFAGCTNLSKVSLCDGIIHIGTGAFMGCRHLKSVSIPESVTEIDDGAFYNCEYLESVVFPSEFKGFLPSYLFCYCTNLKNFVIPDGVTFIDQYCFYSCESLESIEIPNGVLGIGKAAFYMCNSLKSVDIPEKVTYIDEWTFGWSDSIESINLPESIEYINDFAFYGCSGLKELKLGKNIKGIGACSFVSCPELEVVLDEENESFKMEEEALYSANMERLIWTSPSKSGSFRIPSTVKEIDPGAMSMCSKLTRVIIPRGVSAIRDNLFWGCTSLISVTVPSSVKIIEQYAFDECESLKTVYFAGAMSKWNDIEKENGWDYGVGDLKVECITSDELVFILSDDNSSYSVKGIDESVYGEIIIPSTYKGLPVTTICDKAFYMCTELQIVNISDGITNIGDYAFFGDQNIRIISVPKSVDHIGMFAFDKYSNGIVRIDEENPSYYTADGCIIETETGTLIVCCRYYYTVPLGKNIKSIADYAFFGNLSTLEVIPNDVEHIGKFAFANNHNLIHFLITGNVKSIGEGVLSGCNSLKRIAIAGCENYKVNNGCLIEVETKTVMATSNDFVIPTDGSVTKIGNYAFYDRSAIENIVIPDSITSIGDNAFAGSGIKEIEIPESVEQIGEGAFDDCENLIAIHGVAGSVAESVAKQYGIAFYGTYKAEENDLIVKSLGAEVPEGSTIKSTVCDSSEIIGQPGIDDAVVYDIVFEKNEEVQAVTGDFIISIPLPEGFAPGRTNVFYINGDGDMEVINSSVEEGFVVFKTNHFSKYAVVLYDHLAGDINDDGLIDNKDVTRLLRYVSGWDVDVMTSALDVNGDGLTNIKDALRLLKYVSEYDVGLF